MANALVRIVGFSLTLGAFGLVGLSACSKSNEVSADNSVGKCSVPAGTCPEGYSPEVAGEGSIEDCEQDGEGSCKKVGSCTVRCVDPRGCTAVGSKCGDDQPACCGETAGTHSCIRFAKGETVDVKVCSKRCEASSDCPGSCCDASINSGTFAACAPFEVCVTTGIPKACLDCLMPACPDEYEVCKADETCAACLNGDMYPSSPECRANGTLRKGYACAVQACPDVCQM